MRLETNDLFGIDRGQGDGHGHAPLVSHGTRQQLGEISIRQGITQGLAQPTQALRNRLHRGLGPSGRMLAQQGKSHPGRSAIDGGGDQHGHRHKLAARLAPRLCGQHIGQAHAQGEHAADVTQRPAPTTDAAHGLGLGQFGQKRGGQRFAIGEKGVGQHQNAQSQRHLPRPHQRQSRGAEHAASRHPHQQALFARHAVSPCAQTGHGEHHDQIRQAQPRSPGQGGPIGTIGHTAHKVGRKHRRDDHRGITRVGKVVHGPAKHLAQANARVQCRTKTVEVHGALLSVQMPGATTTPASAMTA